MLRYAVVEDDSRVFIFEVLVLHFSIDVPIFLTSLAPHLVKKINESTVLQCKVRSNPLAQIEWYKNGKKLHNGSNVLILDEVVSRNDYQSIVESNLHLNPLNKMDSGNYTCKFQNNVGSKQADGKLIVLCKYILKSLININHI